MAPRPSCRLVDLNAWPLPERERMALRRLVERESHGGRHGAIVWLEGRCRYLKSSQFTAVAPLTRRTQPDSLR